MQGVQAGTRLGVGAGARRARQAWDRVVTCSGPVNTQPKGLLGHAYEIGGSTEVLAPVPLRHIGQAEARVCLHIFTDPGLRGQETRFRHALRQPGLGARQEAAGPGPHRGPGGLPKDGDVGWLLPGRTLCPSPSPEPRVGGPRSTQRGSTGQAPGPWPLPASFRLHFGPRRLLPTPTRLPCLGTRFSLGFQCCNCPTQVGATPVATGTKRRAEAAGSGAPALITHPRVGIRVFSPVLGYTGSGEPTVTQPCTSQWAQQAHPAPSCGSSGRSPRSSGEGALLSPSPKRGHHALIRTHCCWPVPTLRTVT